MAEDLHRNIVNRDFNLAKRSTVLLISMAFSGGVSSLISIVIARNLGVEDFGLYSVIVSIQSIVGFIGGFCINLALAKIVAENLRVDVARTLEFVKTGLLFVAIIVTISCIAYVSLSDLISNDLYGNPSIASLVPYSTLVVIGSVLFYTAFGIVQGWQRLRLMAGMQISQTSLSLLSIVLLVPYYGIRGVFLSFFIVQSMIAVVVLGWVSRNGLPFVHARLQLRNSTVVRELINFSFPALLSGLVIVSVVWLGNTELVLRSGLEPMGYFAIAFVFYNALNLIPQSIVIPLMPRLSELKGRSPEASQSALTQALAFASIVLLPAFLAILLFSGPLVNFLYGIDATSAGDVASLLVVACYFYAISSILNGVIVSRGRMWLNLALNLVWAVTFIPVSLVTIPAWNENGLAASYVLSWGINLGTAIFFMKRLLGVRISQQALWFITLGLTVLVLSCALITFCEPLHSFERVILLAGVTVASVIVTWRIRGTVLGVDC